MIIKNNFSTIEDFQLFAHSHQLILFDFYADWCEPCKMLDEILVDLDQQLPSEVVICKIDVDQNLILQKHFSIMSVPTLMIYNEGKMEWRMPGFELVQDLKKRLEAFLDE
ncbi:MAG: thioredoxin family protein [Bacteroidota bacterium]